MAFASLFLWVSFNSDKESKFCFFCYKMILHSINFPSPFEPFFLPFPGIRLSESSLSLSRFLSLFVLKKNLQDSDNKSSERICRERNKGPSPAMDSSSASSIDGLPDWLKEKVSMVDPFLLEALQNPRHRLTILRMELDIQRFLQNKDQQLFEFQHFPTSYLRLAAHRVAQHYFLQTMVQDNAIDGQGRILVRKTAEARFPPVCLSQIPAKQLADNKPGRVKIVIRPRPNKSSDDAAGTCMDKQSLSRTVEQRKEEYDKARARIFSSHGSTDSVDLLSHAFTEGLDLSTNRDGDDGCRVNDVEKYTSIKDAGSGATSRVAILRDREKDLSDPDYDRSYGRYVKNLPINPSMNFAPFPLQNVQPSFTGYHVPRNEVSLGYVSPSPIRTVELNQISRTTANAPWPCAGMPYAHTAFRAPLYQQSLSFGYLQYH